MEKVQIECHKIPNFMIQVTHSRDLEQVMNVFFVGCVNFDLVLLWDKGSEIPKL